MLKEVKSLIKKRIKKQTVIYSILIWVYKTSHLPACLYAFVRSQSLITKLFGPRYIRNPKRIEINITYRCNLGCPNCTVSCGQGQAPSNIDMTVEQIQRLIQESIDKDVKWYEMRVIGGEPTLHPNFFEILRELLEYKRNHSPRTRISLSTNGYGQMVRDNLSKVSKEVVIIDSSKESKTQLFYRFNMAPKDSIWYKYADYSNACYVTALCGTSLTPFGYYPCLVAGGIDRVVGFDLGRKELPSFDDKMLAELQVFCELCGLFGCQRYTYKPLQSPTWKISYEKYKNEKQELSRY